jgi:hypothetical protein
MNIEDLFKQGPLEGIVSAALRDTIIAHGPVTRDWIGSASKRVVAAFRGRVLDLVKTDKEAVVCSAHSEQIEKLQKEVEELRSRLSRANSQERRWRKKLVQNNIPLDGEVKPSLDEYASTIRLAFEIDNERFTNLFDADTIGEVYTLAKSIEEDQ